MNDSFILPRNLVKNLLLGFISASASDKPSVLRVMATVLDFNETERDKSGLNNSSAHGGWFSGLLHSGNPTKVINCHFYFI